MRCATRCACSASIRNALPIPTKVVVDGHAVGLSAAGRRAAPACLLALSEEFVGDVGFRQLTKWVVQGDFRDVEGAETVDFRMVNLALLFKPSTTPLESCFLAGK